ncbi:MAG: sugar phosphate isomerase/epimerase [Gemmataceae bacterium]|nr:sugar phosphate isomerase/epimerase [Gemmataceae bacterium]
MQLGFVSAILPDLYLEQVMSFAANAGFGCVEVMCWPPGTADRRYAGVTHLDVTSLDNKSAGKVKNLVEKTGVAISGLGYYPNPLHPDPEHRKQVIEHLKKVISAAPLVDVRVVNTFVGRDWKKSIPENWPLFQQTWPDIVQHAEKEGVHLGIENCPMLFSLDEWPGGANLATTPALWEMMFEAIPSPHFGLNYDPSHLIWQHIDPVRAIRDFGKKIVHFHAKDTRIDHDKLYEVGITGLGWHTPKIPGLGDVPWGLLFSALTDTGYNGPVCIEVEDRAFEKSLDDRKRSLRQSKKFLEQFVQ